MSQGCHSPVQPPGTKSVVIHGYSARIQPINSFDRCTFHASSCSKHSCFGTPTSTIFRCQYGTRMCFTHPRIVVWFDQYVSVPENSKRNPSCAASSCPGAFLL